MVFPVRWFSTSYTSWCTETALKLHWNCTETALALEFQYSCWSLVFQSLRDRDETALKLHWDCTGTALEPHWNRTAPSSVHISIETALKLPWNCTGTGLEPHWNRTGTALEPHCSIKRPQFDWNWAGSELKLHWNRTEATFLQSDSRKSLPKDHLPLRPERQRVPWRNKPAAPTATERTERKSKGGSGGSRGNPIDRTCSICKSMNEIRFRHQGETLAMVMKSLPAVYHMKHCIWLSPRSFREGTGARHWRAADGWRWRRGSVARGPSSPNFIWPLIGNGWIWVCCCLVSHIKSTDRFMRLISNEQVLQPGR